MISTPKNPTITGHAAIFNSETNIAGMFREIVRPGAFTAAIGRDDCRALFNHDANYVLGRTKSGTLTLTEDDHGLRYDVTLPNTTWAKDLYTSIQRGDVSQSSFSFRTIQERWTSDHLPLRELLELELYDVSPVVFPAYPSTSVSARAAGIELTGAATEGRSATLESGDALRRLRLLRAAPSACEQCRVGVATRLVGNRERRHMRFSGVCVACSHRLHLDRRAGLLRRDDRALALREREFKLLYQ